MAIPPTLMRTTATFVLAVFSSSLNAQERIDYEAVAKIRKEGRANSQIMRTLHFLTDAYGPRVTGSPNHKTAAEWVAKQTTTWGFVNAHLEPWDFGHPGWLNERFAGYIVSPVKDSLVGDAEYERHGARPCRAHRAASLRSRGAWGRRSRRKIASGHGERRGPC